MVVVLANLDSLALYHRVTVSKVCRDELSCGVRDGHLFCYCSRRVVEDCSFASLSCYLAHHGLTTALLCTPRFERTRTRLWCTVWLVFSKHIVRMVLGLFFFDFHGFFFALVTCMERQLSDCSCDENAQNRIAPITTHHKFLREGSTRRFLTPNSCHLGVDWVSGNQWAGGRCAAPLGQGSGC